MKCKVCNYRESDTPICSRCLDVLEHKEEWIENFGDCKKQ